MNILVCGDMNAHIKGYCAEETNAAGMLLEDTVDHRSMHIANKKKEWTLRHVASSIETTVDYSLISEDDAHLI